jgi:hypothetical protein
MAEMKAGQMVASLEYWMAASMASSSGLRSAVKKVDVLARLLELQKGVPWGLS